MAFSEEYLHRRIVKYLSMYSCCTLPSIVYLAVRADGVFHHLYAEFCGLHSAEAWSIVPAPDWLSWGLVGD